MAIAYYPHERYMKQKGIEINDLPPKIRNLANTWLHDKTNTTHENGKNDPELKTVSEEIKNEIIAWRERVEEKKEEEEKPQQTQKAEETEPKGDKYNKILHAFYKEGIKKVNLSDLKSRGYNTGFFMPMVTKNYKLKPVKDEKGWYNIIKR